MIKITDAIKQFVPHGIEVWGATECGEVYVTRMNADQLILEAEHSIFAAVQDEDALWHVFRRMWPEGMNEDGVQCFGPRCLGAMAPLGAVAVDNATMGKYYWNGDWDMEEWHD
jgi:hypothetical protein